MAFLLSEKVRCHPHTRKRIYRFLYTKFLLALLFTVFLLECGKELQR